MLGDHTVYCRQQPNAFKMSIPNDSWTEFGEDGDIVYYSLSMTVHGTGMNTKYERQFYNAGWKYISSIDLTQSHRDVLKYIVDLDTLPKRVIRTINEIISAVILEPYDIMKSAYSNSAGSGDRRVFYKIFVSPDNGVLFIDHISKYKDPLIRARFNSTKFIVTEPAQYYFNCGIAYTKAVGYKFKTGKNELAAQSDEFNHTELIKKYIKAVEQGTYIACLNDTNYWNDNTYRPKDKCQEIKYDRNDHIWYAAVSHSTIWGRVRVPSQLSRKDAPANYKPLDFTNLPKQFKITTFCFGAVSPKQWKAVVRHPKIIGYQNHAYPGFIVYCVSDLTFADKLLGPGASAHMLECGQVFVKGDTINEYYRCFPFVWFNDKGMKDIDNYLDDPSIRLSSLIKSLKAKNPMLP